MEAEYQIFARYEGAFAAIAALDRAYYLNTSPTSADRRDYAARQDQLAEMRARFYGELASLRSQAQVQRRCRYFCRISLA
jgi:hypothetical protein